MKRSFSLCLLALACVGCSPIGPDYERPALEIPANWKTLPGANPALWKTAEPSDGVPKDRWWTSFNDKTLSQLIERCLENNNTLQASLARLDQAIAQSEARGAAQFPVLSAAGTGSRTLTSANRPTTTYDSVNISTVQNDFRPIALMTYEIDWLGKIRRDVEASRNTAEQAAADTENVRLLLAAQVANSYFLLRQYDEEIRVLTTIVGLQDKLLSLIQKRYDLGAAGQTELSQQKALTQSSGAQLELLNNLRNLQENLLATLTATPAANFKLAAGSLPQTLPAFPVSLPSNLLERRPDVAAADILVSDGQHVRDLWQFRHTGDELLDMHEAAGGAVFVEIEPVPADAGDGSTGSDDGNPGRCCHGGSMLLAKNAQIMCLRAGSFRILCIAALF